MNLLIMGAPGSGKGSMCEKLIDKYDLIHLSTGDMLRSAISKQTDLGKQAHDYMSKGELVPDELVGKLIKESLSDVKENQGFLFDGYPRTLTQANTLDEILKSLNLDLAAVINLEISDEKLTKRITGRRTCPKCHEIYNIYYKAPVKEETCDKCGSKLTKREDDNLESLTTRLEVYHGNAKLILDHYQKMQLVVSIDASKAPEEVFSDIVKGLGDKI